MGGYQLLYYILNFIIALLLTSTSYFLGALFLPVELAIWQALIIGTSVVSLGGLVEKLNSPMWLIILTPFPVGMGLLFLFLNASFLNWLITYLLILSIYTLIHIIASRFFQFHSLIPAWKLS